MDKQPVQITIEGIQTVMGERDVTTFITEGFLYTRENASYLSYEDSEADGFPGHSVTLRISDGHFVMNRYGPMGTKLDIVPDTMTPCAYPTPYGVLDLTVLGKEIKGGIRKKGDRITVRYDLIQEGGPPIENQLNITVK